MDISLGKLFMLKILQLKADKEKIEAARAEADKIIVDPLHGLSPQEPTPQSGVAAPDVHDTQEPLTSNNANANEGFVACSTQGTFII